MVVAATVAVETTDRHPAAARPSLTTGPTADCPQERVSSRYAKRVDRALRSRRDSWGEQLLAAPDGPTYEKAQQYLTPLFLARTKNGQF